MKIITKIPFFLVFAVIIFMVTVCENVPIDNPDFAARLTHYSNNLIVSGEQVWLPDYNQTKISSAFIKFIDDHDLFVTVGKINDGVSEGFASVGTGEIKEGLLSFSVSALDDEDLLEKADLFRLCFSYNNVAGWSDNAEMDTDARGNIITLIASYNGTTPEELLIREGFYGTKSLLTGEYIYFIYMDRDCKITAEEVTYPELNYTFNAFEINLKKGWNTLCRTETHTTDGNASFMMKIKNPPDLKWLILDILKE